MTQEDFVKFGRLIESIAKSYSQDINADVVKIYWLVLKRYSYEEVELAAEQVLTTHEYNTMPAPAQFVKAINPPEKLEVRVMEAIKTVEDTMTICGSYRSVVFADPYISATLTQFGLWPQVCRDVAQMDDREYGFWKKDFARIYKALIVARPGLKHTILVGIHDAQNISNGYQVGWTLTLPDGTVKKQLPYCDLGEVKEIQSGLLLPSGEMIPSQRFLTKHNDEKPKENTDEREG